MAYPAPHMHAMPIAADFTMKARALWANCAVQRGCFSCRKSAKASFHRSSARARKPHRRTARFMCDERDYLGILSLRQFPQLGVAHRRGIHGHLPLF